MSEKVDSPSSEDYEKSSGKEYFSYETGKFYSDKERTKELDKSGTVKGKFSYYEFGKLYLTYVGKNTQRALDNTGHRPFYAEDLIKNRFHYLTLNQLKRRIAKLFTELESRGVEVTELAFRSEEIKKEKTKKAAPKGFDDLIAEFGEFPGVFATGKAVKTSKKKLREDSVRDRERYNTQKLTLLIANGEVSIGKNTYKAQIKSPKQTHSREKFLEQFSGNKMVEGQDIHEKPFIKSADLYAVLVKKQGRVTGLSKDEFFAFLTKFYNEKTKTSA